MMPKGHRTAPKREPKRARNLQKGALWKSIDFWCQKPSPANIFWSHFGSQESPGLDVISPGPHFWPLQNVCFYLGFNEIWANGSVCRDLKVIPSSFFSDLENWGEKIRKSCEKMRKMAECRDLPGSPEHLQFNKIPTEYKENKLIK